MAKMEIKYCGETTLDGQPVASSRADRPARDPALAELRDLYVKNVAMMERAARTKRPGPGEERYYYQEPNEVSLELRRFAADVLREVVADLELKALSIQWFRVEDPGERRYRELYGDANFMIDLERGAGVIEQAKCGKFQAFDPDQIFVRSEAARTWQEVAHIIAHEACHAAQYARWGLSYREGKDWEQEAEGYAASYVADLERRVASGRWP